MSPLSWPLDLLTQSPWFSTLQPVLQQLAWQAFPEEADWAAIPIELRPVTTSGQAVVFREPEDGDEQGYEQRIATSGLVATRPDNWHDAFNALCWLNWPRSKAALNALHLRELAVQQGKQRSRLRDRATLFDESGLVLACADPALILALQDHDWHSLFVTRAADWDRLIEPFVLGHALLEKGLQPFVGIVAKVMVVEVAADWFTQPQADKLTMLDQVVAAAIGQLATPAQTLHPLPLLGIPGWWPQQDAAFYANTGHFRPRRQVVHPQEAPFSPLQRNSSHAPLPGAD